MSRYCSLRLVVSHLEVSFGRYEQAMVFFLLLGVNLLEVLFGRFEQVMFFFLIVLNQLEVSLGRHEH